MNPAFPDHLPLVSDEEQEKLSAYLDGELGEADTEDLVAKLARNQELRATAEELKKTWELLDHLPRPHAPEDFTAKTLHKLDTTKVILLTRERRWRRLAAFGWAVTLLLAGGGGFLFAFYWPREQPAVPVVLTETAMDTADDRTKDFQDRQSLPPGLRRMDMQVRQNVHRILVELRGKLTREERSRLLEAASKGTWEYLDELRRLAQVHGIPLDVPLPPPKPSRSPVEETRPKPKSTPRKGAD